MRSAGVIVFTLFLCACSTGATSGESASAPPPAPGQLEGLAWLAGSWNGEGDAGRFEEHWLEPAGGMMLGVHRDVRSSGKAFFEFLRIEEREGEVVYLASPGGRPPTAFALIEQGPSRAVFAKPDHDYPQRILYWIEGGMLHARIEGSIDGQARSSDWVYRRGPDPGR